MKLLPVALLICAALARADDFSVSSVDVTQGANINPRQIADGDGCKGRNMSPDLDWAHAPAQTQSYAITVYDPDAPGGKGWWHWIVFNLSAKVSSLRAGAGDYDSKGIPVGALQGKMSTGGKYWGGVCPPQGDKPHHYIFTVYALKVAKLPASPDDEPEKVSAAIKAAALASASITGVYAR